MCSAARRPSELGVSRSARSTRRVCERRLGARAPGVFRIVGRCRRRASSAPWPRRSGRVTVPWSPTRPRRVLWGIEGVARAQGRALGAVATQPTPRAGRRCTEALASTGPIAHEARHPDHDSGPHPDRPLGADGGRSAPRPRWRAPSGRSSVTPDRLAVRVECAADVRSAWCRTARASSSPTATRSSSSSRCSRRRSGCSCITRCCPLHSATALGVDSPAGGTASTSRGPSTGLALECDGWEHHGGRSAFAPGS